MFHVHTSSPLDDQWQRRDEAIEIAAGRRSEYRGTREKVRWHLWTVTTIDEAKHLQRCLSAVPDVRAEWREAMTG